MQKWRYVKSILNIPILLLLVSLLLTSGSLFAAENSIYMDRTKLISQQLDLLKSRLAQAQDQFSKLQHEDDRQLSDFSLSHSSQQIHDQANLDIAITKSNIDSLNIELSESQQASNRLENSIQEIENQLNVSSIFGLKVARSEALNVVALQAELSAKKNIAELEKTRITHLTNLQKIMNQTLQLEKVKYVRINLLLKSRATTYLQERQAQSEMIYQQQQGMWLERLNGLYQQSTQIEAANVKDKTAYTNVQREIFYANQNLNFTYLKMLLVRYQDQLQQLRITILHSTSITMLHKANEQVQMLAKQMMRIDDLLKMRVSILQQRKTFLLLDKDNADTKIDLARLAEMNNQYQTMTRQMSDLGLKLSQFRVTLDKALQYELSSRQGLPGLSAKAWVDLAGEIWLVPTLTYQVVKSLMYSVADGLEKVTFIAVFMIAVLELGLVMLFIFANGMLEKIISGMAEQELGHINLKRLAIQLLRRNLIDIFVISNVFALFTLSDIPLQRSGFLLNLALVWLFFKAIIIIARVCLVETIHDHAGHDVILYHRLKWSFLMGGIITALTVFMHELPAIYAVNDLFDRMFLLFLLVVSIFLLRSWKIVPELILLHIDDRRLYFKKVVRLLGFLIPLILFINTAIGLFGFVNLVLTVSWYESIFVLVLVGYLIIRGLLIEGMIGLSTVMIRHVINGWLWTEALLKPIDKTLRIGLFLASWVVLFSLYGWNQQSPIVMQLSAVMHYPLVNMLNTSITLLSIVELCVIVSVLFWTARWTREFVYRFLMSRTKDMGLRNSISIFSQYSVIVVGIFICLRVLGIDFRALAVVAGAFAFGVGLGLRDLFNNFACGFLLLIERPIRVGDTVSVDNFEGEVTHIGGRAVTIRTWDHMDVLVPNTEIFSKSFTNWTSRDHIIRSVVAIKINRHDNPQEVQAVIYQVLSTHKDVLDDPVPEVFLKDISDSLIEFEIRYFLNLRLVKSRTALRSDVLLSICEAFAKHGIQPPYPQHEVHVRNDGVPTLDEKHLLIEQQFPEVLAGIEKG